MQARNGLCSLIVAVPQSEGWHWHLQPRNVTLITPGSCSGRLIVEQKPSGFRPSWLQIGVPGQVRRGPVPLPELPPPYQVLVWSGIWGDHLGNFSDHSQGRCGRAAVGTNFTPNFLSCLWGPHWTGILPCSSGIFQGISFHDENP